MKIGIVTVYDALNYGAFLQAYGMMKYLEQLGHEVYFVKYRDLKDIDYLELKQSINIKHFIRNLQNVPHNHKKYKFMCSDQKYLPKLPLKSINSNNLDAIIIGSDEIWNSTVAVFQGNVFYGIDVDVKYKFAYAPSLGCAGKEDIQKNIHLYNRLNEVNIIGLRDEGTRKLIQPFSAKTIPMVCDPTLLVDENIFSNHKNNISIKNPYLFVYAYRVDRKQREYLRKFANENNLLLVSACMKHNWCDKNVNISALDFYNIIKNAEYVYTATFHGAIFTFMNHKQCIIDARTRKLNEFLKQFGMDKLILRDCSYKEFKDLYSTKIDYCEYDSKVNSLRETSRYYINKALVGCND